MDLMSKRPNSKQSQKTGVWKNVLGQVLQSNISKIIMLDAIIFGVIHKKVGTDFPGETFGVLIIDFLLINAKM
jgi:hypothetical protein